MPGIEPEPVRCLGVVRVQRGDGQLLEVDAPEMREGESGEREHPLRVLPLDTFQGRGTGRIDAAQESGGGLVFLLMIKDGGAILGHNKGIWELWFRLLGTHYVFPNVAI